DDIRFQIRYRLSFKFASKSSIVSLSTPAEPALALTALKASYTSRFGMVNGFAVVTRFLLSPVERERWRLDPPPLLRPHYWPSTLLQDGPSPCSALVARLAVHAAWASPLASERQVPAVPHESPDSGSRLLYAGRRPPNHQALGGLVPGDRNAPGFDDMSLDYDASTEVYFRSSL